MRSTGLVFGFLGLLVFFILLITAITSAPGDDHRGDISHVYGYGVMMQFLLPVLVIALIVGVLGVVLAIAAKKPGSKSPEGAPSEPQLDETEHRCRACDTLHRFQDLGIGDAFTCRECGERVEI